MTSKIDFVVKFFQFKLQSTMCRSALILVPADNHVSGIQLYLKRAMHRHFSPLVCSALSAPHLHTLLIRSVFHGFSFHTAANRLVILQITTSRTETQVAGFLTDMALTLNQKRCPCFCFKELVVKPHSYTLYSLLQNFFAIFVIVLFTNVTDISI